MNPELVLKVYQFFYIAVMYLVWYTLVAVWLDYTLLDDTLDD